MSRRVEIRRVGPDDIEVMNALLRTLGQVFEDMPTYTANPPGEDYLRQLLGGDAFIALAALDGNKVVGGIAAYELQKFEQARSEIYIYDLAVVRTHRRQGIATGLIAELGRVAAARGAHAMFVQADVGVEDAPAIALYETLGTREEVLHFDIPVKGKDADEPA
jgi:aminoglycoside 3-N-acetyltransferase I